MILTNLSNKYLKRNKTLLKKLISYGNKIDCKIWIALDKEIMHVTKTELFILNYSSKLGLRKEAESVIRFCGIGEPTEVGYKYEAITATLLAIALLDKVGSVGAKTAKFRAEKKRLKGKMKTFGQKFEGMSTTALKDFEGLQERYQNQLAGMTQQIGSNYDELANNLQTITKKQGTLKTGTVESIEEQAQEQMMETAKLTGERMEFEQTDSIAKYTAGLEASRMQLTNQLDDIKRRYERAKRHDRWYENLG